MLHEHREGVCPTCGEVRPEHGFYLRRGRGRWVHATSPCTLCKKEARVIRPGPGDRDGLRVINYYLEPFSARQLENDDTDAEPRLSHCGFRPFRAPAPVKPCERGRPLAAPGDAETWDGQYHDPRKADATDLWAEFAWGVLEEYRDRRLAELSGAELSARDRATLAFVREDPWFHDVLENLGLDPGAVRRAWEARIAEAHERGEQPRQRRRVHGRQVRPLEHEQQAA